MVAPLNVQLDIAACKTSASVYKHVHLEQLPQLT